MVTEMIRGLNKVFVKEMVAGYTFIRDGVLIRLCTVNFVLTLSGRTNSLTVLLLTPNNI